MKVSKDFLGKMNTLLARSRDASKGYVEASRNLNNGSELFKWMHEYADQRLKFSVDLENEIQKMGGDSDFDTSVLGDLHRAWIDIKGSFSDNEQVAMLEECHRGETKAHSDYQEILDEFGNMPVSTRQMLVDQQSKIKGAIAQIETMIKWKEELAEA